MLDKRPLLRQNTYQGKTNTALKTCCGGRKHGEKIVWQRRKNLK
jgi:hypothetical protein